MLLFFCPSVTWLAFYICNTQKLGLLFKREREGGGRERERECQMEKCHCSHISIRAAAAAAHWQMGIPQKCEALVIWEITKHHQPSSSLQGLIIIGKPGNRRKCRLFFLLLLLLFRIWRYVHCGICKPVEYKSWIRFLPKQMHCVQDKANHWEAR